MKQLAYTINPLDIGLPTKFENLGGLISTLLPAAVTLAGMAAFIFLIIGGFRYMTAGGDEKAVADAMKIITNAVIGLVIVFGAWFAIRIIETVLGLHITGVD
ncbi:MAG: pilin [Patescibacteria group bacterium]